MPGTIKTAAGTAAALTLILIFLNRWHPAGVLFSLAVTFGTISYHLLVRLLIGACFDRLMQNRADVHAAWYQPKSWEQPLYEKLRVRKWKLRMPAYQPELFDPGQRTWDEIAQAMCQSELVHETIIIASFLPLFASIRFGAFSVFLITSVAAALFDLTFVIMQRYNRPRVVRIAERERKRNARREK